MMKFTDSTNKVVLIIHPDGRQDSFESSLLTADEIAIVLPADPLPNPRIEEIKAELASIDLKSIRAIREGDTVRITQWDAQAAALRAELLAIS